MPTARSLYLERTYGLSLEEYDMLLLMQGGVCAVCFKPPKPGVHLHVEHDHTTKQIRGLVCAYDNLRVIGRRRDWQILQNAANYLRYGATNVQNALGRVALVPKKKKVKRGTKN